MVKYIIGQRRKLLVLFPKTYDTLVGTVLKRLWGATQLEVHRHIKDTDNYVDT